MTEARSPLCHSGAHKDCPHEGGAYSCGCECHVHQTVRLGAPRVPEPPSVAWEVEVVARATRLCNGDEPHIRREIPCVVHRSEARRGLFGAWMGQDNRPEGATA